MSQEKNNFPLLFPQEVLELIVDEVAYQIPVHMAQDQSDLREIIACTLVSRSFHFRARAHLYKAVCLRTPASRIDVRASKLLRSLGDGVHNPSIPALQSLSISICDSKLCSINDLPTVSQTSRQEDGSLSELIRYALLDLDPPLQHFSFALNFPIRRERGGLEERWASLYADRALQPLFRNSNLKSLHLANIATIPATRLAEVFYLPHLTELTLSGLTFTHEAGELPDSSFLSAETHRNARKIAPSLGRLEMRNLPCDELLHSVSPDLLIPTGNPTQPPQIPCSSTRSTFSQLRRLTFSLPFDENKHPALASLTKMEAFMEKTSPTLEKLEIENYEYPAGDHVPRYFNHNASRIPLAKLSTLKTFRFTLRSDTPACLEFLRRILMDLNLHCRRQRCQCSLETCEFKVTIPCHHQDIASSKTWQAIDTFLATSPAFSALKDVKILVIIFQTIPRYSTALRALNSLSAADRKTIEKSWSGALPKVFNASPRIRTTVTVQMVFSQDTLERFLCTSRTQD